MLIINLVKMIFSIFVIFLFSFFYVEAIDCPSDQSNFNQNNVDLHVDMNMQIGTVDYYLKVNLDNTSEFYVDWSSLDHKNPNLMDKTIKKMLLYEIIFAIADATHSSHIKYYYKTKCKATIHCYLEQDKDQNFICCDDPNDTPDPQVWTYQQKTYVIQPHIVECGYKCCVKNFQMSYTWDDYYKVWYANLDSWTIGTYPGSVCSNNPSFTDAVTGLPIPCDGDCNEDDMEN